MAKRSPFRSGIYCSDVNNNEPSGGSNREGRGNFVRGHHRCDSNSVYFKALGSCRCGSQTFCDLQIPSSGDAL